MEKYLFSVVVPVYNAEAYLGETLRNLNGLRGDFSVVFVDDGSSDGSVRILHDYCAKKENAILIEKDHRGVSVARNCGLVAAQGEYILFMDADDAYENSVFDVLERRVRQVKPDIVVFGAKINNYSERFKLNDIQPRDFFIADLIRIFFSKKKGVNRIFGIVPTEKISFAKTG